MTVMPKNRNRSDQQYLAEETVILIKQDIRCPVGKPDADRSFLIPRCLHDRIIPFTHIKDRAEYELLVREHLYTRLSDLPAPIHESFTVCCLDVIFFDVLSQLLDDTLIDTASGLLIYDMSSHIVT